MSEPIINTLSFNSLNECYVMQGNQGKGQMVPGKRIV